MEITNIDFSNYDESDEQVLSELAQAAYEALATTGFLSVTNIGIGKELRDEVFTMSKSFFSLPDEVKDKVSYLTPSENFGFQGLGKEKLNPSMPADMKEAFTMRDLSKYLEQENRWPSEEFKNMALCFYNECFESARKLMKVFSKALNVDQQFFIEKHRGDNVTLRFLHYPICETTSLTENQLGAGAHTDYGMITLLFQDGVEGLEVKDKHGNWISAPADPNKILINTGDLMHRWTNDIFRSTPHRVRPVTGNTDRYSIAMFIDPDPEVMIETIPSCVSDDREDRYEPISAGKHILDKITATQVAY